ncbi:uncharacterized protein [Linepithema humile]|uniref:uncharacterized protein n=1 Tax=Linepithema humile TaxID=83485 RepID=UPI00351DB5E9
MSSLDILPNELLLIIFNLCDVYTLLQLRSVCKKFDRISSYVLNKKSNRLLITNQMSEKFRERCKPPLSSYNSKFITFYNWKFGIPFKHVVNNLGPRETTRDIRINKKCLKMTKNTIWFYDTDILSACNRAESGTVTVNIIRGTCNCEFSSIADCNDIIISGHVDGSIRHWKIESRNNINNLQQLKAHSNVYGEYVSNIEATTQHIISSSSNLIKVQKNTYEDDGSAEESETIYTGKKLIQSISLDPKGTKVAASAEKSLLIYDINKNCLVMDELINNNICSQLLWEDPHTILMLYERQIQKMDTRTSTFVRTWNTSVLHNNPKLYSFSSDYLYTIMTGTDLGSVLLWDQRINDCIRTYQISISRSNPVLSVQFDSFHMYTITELEGVSQFYFGDEVTFDSAQRKKYFSKRPIIKTNMSSLDILPEELLEIIFNLCNVYTLLQLRSVCKRFDRISSYVLNEKSNRLLITNQMSEKFRERCKPPLSSYNSKFFTHYNWKYGIPFKYVVNSLGPRETTRDMRINKKCLKMTKNTILFYDNDILSACNRAESGSITGNVIRGICNCEFSSIAYCNDIIISGHVDGSIRHWRIESQNNINNLQQLKAHSNVYDEYVSNIEATTQQIISSSSNLIKIQKNTFEDSAEKNEPIYKGKKFIQSISLDPTEKKVAASTEESFLIYNIDAKYFSCLVMDNRINDNTCSQLLWEDPHAILMLYERQIKKMDTRTPNFVRTWDASVLHNNPKLYSFSSDYLYTIMTGTDINSVLLWDQRFNYCIRTYEISFIRSNPVLSVQFDSSHMYAITETQGVIQLYFGDGVTFNSAHRKKYFNKFI